MKLSTKQRLRWNAVWRWLRGQRDTLLRDIEAVYPDLEPELQRQFLSLVKDYLAALGTHLALHPGLPPWGWTRLRALLAGIEDATLAALRREAVDLAEGVK